MAATVSLTAASTVAIASNILDLNLPTSLALIVVSVVAGLVGLFLDDFERAVGALPGAGARALRGSAARLRAAARRLPRRRPAVPLPGRRVLAPVAAFAVAAAVAYPAASLAVRAPAFDDRAPCRPPIELRVLTGPENRDAVQESVAAFAARETDGACRPVNVTVFPAASFTDVGLAFRDGWRRPAAEGTSGEVTPLLLPQPDVWIPASRAEVDHVTEHPAPDVALRDRGAIAASPLVFAVPANFTPRVQGTLPDPSAPTWGSLIDAAERAGLTVARPDPDLSETGLLATAELYRETRDPRARAALEGKIASAGTPRANVLDLLCSLRRDRDPAVAVVVPENAWRAYEQGEPLGPDCAFPVSAPARSYVPLRPARGGSLDYRFVQVTWRDQVDRARDAMIDRLRDWFGDARLRAQGFRDTDGRTSDSRPTGIAATVGVRGLDAAGLRAALRDYPRARPPVTAAYVVDQSGSMQKPVIGRSSRLDRARELAAQALSLLGTTDSVGLWSFPWGRSASSAEPRRHVEPGPVDAARRSSVRRALAGLDRAEGGHTPLYTAIGQAAEELRGKGVNPAIIVFTDGYDSAPGGLSAAALGDRIAAPDGGTPRVVFLAIGGRQCGEPDVRALVREPRVRATCLDASFPEADQLIGRLFTDLRGGRR
ncbi:vWA domain-containing protein [Actinomadura flavalba]|uniref:vWA domain-containing protein n=1 Tax=Actinomadura flavalba TaxID=1120938 RepID=UPI000381599E|nr:VWA domain-containing protein [Actinomadura flavalba]